ncbi:hypothetical protein RCH23_003118 [Cryobacterium sp. CAN_C3]|nr:hypothetical protein [Cryobacterium sp. CAN_C3]
MTFVRMPKVVWDENAAMGLDRSQLRQLFQRARAKSTTDAALVIRMGMLGLRVSEACNVQIDDFAGTRSGHRVLRVMGKGRKPAMIPLPAPVLRAHEECAGDRTVGQLLATNIGTAMDRRSAYRRIKSVGKQAGLPAGLHPLTLRHSSIMAALDSGATQRDAQIFARHADPRMTVRYDRNRGNLDRHAAHGLAAYLNDDAQTPGRGSADVDEERLAICGLDKLDQRERTQPTETCSTNGNQFDRAVVSRRRLFLGRLGRCARGLPGRRLETSSRRSRGRGAQSRPTRGWSGH